MSRVSGVFTILKIAPRNHSEMAEKIAQSVEDLIGKTPLLKLSSSLRDLPSGAWLSEQEQRGRTELQGELCAKIEFTNPAGAIKDRVAQGILDGAEKAGLIQKGGTIVEATSGNTGAGLAMLAAIRGYKAIFAMPDKISAEKINALRAYGAQVYICPSRVEPDDPRSYYSVARRLSKEIPGAMLANQYYNPDNPRSHFESTAPEIWEQSGERVDYLFVGAGTGGTISGCAAYLKQKNPHIKIIAVDPVGSIYYKRIKEGKNGEARPYLVEGVGEDMIPDTMDFSLVDDCVYVTDKESFAATRMLAQKEGLLVGGSCGMVFWGAVQYLQKEEAQGRTSYRAVVILPDSGRSYLTKVFNPLWLRKNEADSAWGALSLGADVHYVKDAQAVEGVE